MELDLEIYNKIVSLLSKSKENKNYELEMRFWADIDKKKSISEEIYKKIFEKMTYSIENNGLSLKYNLENTLDIKLNNNSNNTRLTIHNTDDIKKYWLSEKLDNIKYTFIEKEKLDVVDNLNYNFRISLSNELPKNAAFEKNINLLLSNDYDKYYRLKNRYSIKTEDGLFRIDLTSIKSGKGKTLRLSNTLKEVPSFEVEIEFVGKESNMQDSEIINKMINYANIIVKIIQNNDILLKTSVKKNVIGDYKKLIKTNIDNYFIAANPVTIHRENLIKNSNIKNIYDHYAVTLKADGERYFLFVTESENTEENGKMYLLNNNFDVIDTGLKDITWANSLIEGELVDKTFFMYDMLFAKGQDIRRQHLINFQKEKTYSSRLENLETFFKSTNRIISPLFKDKFIELKKKPYQFSIRNDGTDIFQKVKDIWDTRKYNAFHVDGIIFVPIREYYPLKKGSWQSLFKWKPPYLNTIDFLIKFNKDEFNKDIKSPYIEIIKRPDGKEETLLKQYKTVKLYVTGRKNVFNNITRKMNYEAIPLLFNPFQLDEKNSHLYNTVKLFLDDNEKIFAIDPITNEKTEVLDDSIIEFAYDETKDDGFKWVPCRFRKDKTNLYKSGEPMFGNAEFVANDNFRAIKNPVTEEMISSGIVPIEEKSAENSDKPYFAQLGQNENVGKRERFPYQNFHNFFIKYQLYYLSSPAHILEYKNGTVGKLFDLCCGKGVDINKIKKAKYAEVVGMDIDLNNIKFAQNYYSKIVPMPKPKGYYVRGDSGKLIWPEQACCKTEAEKLFLKKQVPTKYYFDTISLMFCIHYLFEDEIKLRTLLQNLNDNLKIGGFVVGTTFDGNRIYEQLKDKESIQGKTFSGETMWKIEKKYGNSKFSMTEKRANFGKKIDVFIKTIGQVHTEFLVNFAYLDKIMQEYGFSLVMRKPFEDFYKELMENEKLLDLDTRELEMDKNVAKSMSEEEKRFSFLSSGFMYKKEKNCSDSLFKKLVELMEKKGSFKKPDGVEKVDEDTEHLIEYTEEGNF
jgi:hypothetical protein